MAVAFETHDHGRCVQTLVAEAERVAAKQKLRLTPIRRRVLELLLEDHRAVGAYYVLARLQSEGLGTHPPVAYRALDFLVEHGFAHKLERLNAFVACDCPQDRHRPAFLICRDCSAVAESDAGAVARALAATASRAGFRIDNAAIEAEGLCPSCQVGAV